MILNQGCGCPGGAEEGSQGVERSGNPWWYRKLIRILKGCERSFAISHPSRMRPSSLTVPGVSASLQPLATLLNPFGVISLVLIASPIKVLRSLVALLHCASAVSRLSLLFSGGN